MKKIINSDWFQFVYGTLKAVYIIVSAAALIFSIYIISDLDYFAHVRKDNQPTNDETKDIQLYYEDYVKFFNHADEMLILYEDNWNNASKEEKQKGAEQVVYLAAGCLNLPGQYKLEITDLKYGDVEYDFNKNAIKIDSYYLYTSSSLDVFKCIYHQMTKIYELNCLFAYYSADDIYKNLDIFNRARAYDEDRKNGGTYAECPYEVEYYKNMEQDAQAMTEDMAYHFFKFIANYQFRDEIAEIDLQNYGYSMWNRD